MKIFFNIIDIKYMLQGRRWCKISLKMTKINLKVVNKPCLQFHHIEFGGNDKVTHWIFLHFYPLFDKTSDCHVYDTMDYHELDFNVLSHIGIINNLRISNRCCFQYLDAT